MKINFMKIRDNIMIHRQIERRDEAVFMRMKMRPMVFIRQMPLEEMGA